MKDLKNVYFHSKGESGNIYYILALVKRVLTNDDFNNLQKRVFSSKSYNEALTWIREYVDLIDLDGEL